MTTKEAWKPVTISGVTGILMGAGTVYGVQAFASGNGEEVVNAADGLKMASVNDNLSFAKAFEAARAEVGPGGVFTWRGNIYNTYTADEWRAMSHNEQQQFALQVKPEVSAADVDTEQIADNETVVADQDDDVRIADDNTTRPDYDVEIKSEHNQDVRVESTTWEDIAQNDDDDVRILGFKDVEIGYGRSITMQEMEISGQRVAVIDVDKDGNPDLAMSDLNHNHQMDDGEILDLHTGEPLSFTNDDCADTTMPNIDPSMI